MLGSSYHTDPFWCRLKQPLHSSTSNPKKCLGEETAKQFSCRGAKFLTNFRPAGIFCTLKDLWLKEIGCSMYFSCRNSESNLNLFDFCCTFVPWHQFHTPSNIMELGTGTWLRLAHLGTDPDTGLNLDLDSAAKITEANMCDCTVACLLKYYVCLFTLVTSWHLT